MAARSGGEAQDRLIGARAAEKAGHANALRGRATDVECQIEVWPRDRRHYDCLNLHYRLKAQLDGICQVLGLDDYRLNPVTIVRREVRPPGCVIVRLRVA